MKKNKITETAYVKAVSNEYIGCGKCIRVCPESIFEAK